ncbi:hypothetical protein KC19_VG008200 [Ceratodon purpureus]|uniref:Secreted protein n=1 Tax=Ceratodon purpureus TaxID=3225 RepID=A0A8T0HKQ0_CERPU|nr:hypothetical protein KC19_VG008000 [Ceratodon purpureus]KAG0571390.1 hypothetical protein KC19_VG008100 [Ceratodon purpureus]KAG0571391.1 hypothetical protein KC19_VG008200 [Ceratodon purpureus]
MLVTVCVTLSAGLLDCLARPCTSLLPETARAVAGTVLLEPIKKFLNLLRAHLQAESTINQTLMRSKDKQAHNK